MGEKVNARNIASLNENDKTLNGKLSELIERVQRLEANVARLTAEAANTRQLVGHTLGRGMGSTKGD